MNPTLAMLILVVLSGLALLYFLVGCQHKYRVTASNQDRDILQCSKCRKVKTKGHRKYRKVHGCLFLVAVGSTLINGMSFMLERNQNPLYAAIPLFVGIGCMCLAIHIFHKSNTGK